MKTKRRRRSAAFKAKVALDALRGGLTVVELAVQHGVHQTLINTWKRQGMENMAEVFDGKADAASTDHGAKIAKLHAKIGELAVERDFLKAGERANATGSREPANGR